MNQKKGFLFFLIGIFFFLCFACFVSFLFSPTRELIIRLAEQFVFHAGLSERHYRAAGEALSVLGISGAVLILFIVFCFFTPPGKLILKKINFIDVTGEEASGFLRSITRWIFIHRFELFCAASGLYVFVLTLSRAANTGITTDEANTYFDLVIPGPLEALMRSQYLNNHILNSILIRLTCFLTGTRFAYNEFFIRIPNLVFYVIYLVFAYKTAAKSSHGYFVFCLFAFNYYISEFFGLARGYGMACACMTALLYYFDGLKRDLGNDRLRHRFFCWCSLAALSNGITLYTIFCVLLILLFKYRKNIFKLSNCLYFFVFLFVAAYIVFVSRPNTPGATIATTDNIYESLVSAVFGTFSLSLPYLALIVFVLFVLFATFSLVSSKMGNDYALIYFIFYGISFFSNIVFHRGYPIYREMVPFYPVIVFTIYDIFRPVQGRTAGGVGIKKVVPPIFPRVLFILASFFVFTQFFLQIDLMTTQAWNSDYPKRQEVFIYALEHNIKDGFKSAIYDRHGVVGRFYAEKLSSQPYGGLAKD